jgi:protein-disulfide isomerase
MRYLASRVSCVVLILGIVLTSSCNNNQDAKKQDSLANENESTFIRDHSPTLGSEDAQVALVEFFDPACEACAAFSPFVKNMMAANPGKIRLILRYAPFHTGSDYFVKILEASRKQDKYWETLDVLFKSQPYWASHHKPQPEKIWQFLPKAGLDIEQLRRDMNDPAIVQIIQQDLDDAKALKVDKTPGFFANGKPLQTFGYQQLQALVESEIRANYPE